MKAELHVPRLFGNKSYSIVSFYYLSTRLKSKLGQCRDLEIEIPSGKKGPKELSCTTTNAWNDMNTTDKGVLQGILQGIITKLKSLLPEVTTRV